MMLFNSKCRRKDLQFDSIILFIKFLWIFIRHTLQFVKTFDFNQTFSYNFSLANVRLS